MCNNPRATLTVRRDRIPDIWEHINNAIDEGHPSCLTYFPLYDADNDPPDVIQYYRGLGNVNRNSALLHFQVEDGGRGYRQGYSRDEYPFACTLEGGTDSSVRYVPNTEQNTQGGQIGSLVRNNHLGRGDRFHVVGIPEFE